MAATLSTHPVSPSRTAKHTECTKLTKFEGTTGKPKGVDVTHKNVANLVCLSPGGLGVRPGLKVGQILNISFDMGKQPPSKSSALEHSY
jgi:hypothetical protein